MERIDHMKYLEGMEDIGSEIMDEVISLSLIHISVLNMMITLQAFLILI